MAPAEDDISIEEKRVYAGTAGRTDAYVATGVGVVRVSLSADKVGAFDMVAREPASDVAVLRRDGDPDLIGAATADGLLVAAAGDDPAFEQLVAVDSESGVAVGTEPIVAVGIHDGAFLVAGEDGGIDRIALADPAAVPDESPAGTTTDATGDTQEATTTDATATRIGTVPDPRAIDGPLVAAADGVYRVVESSGAESDLALSAVGLDDARDVAGAGMPLAATAAGLYWLGNGWMTALSGDATSVAADGDGHAMAAVDGDLHVHPSDATEWEAETWRTAELPVDEEPVALGYGPGLSVAVTAVGTLCVDAGDGWRHQVIGVREVAGVALAVVE